MVERDRETEIPPGFPFLDRWQSKASIFSIQIRDLSKISARLRVKLQFLVRWLGIKHNSRRITTNPRSSNLVSSLAQPRMPTYYSRDVVIPTSMNLYRSPVSTIRPPTHFLPTE